MNSDAKSLVELARDTDNPTSRDRARIRQRLEAMLGPGAFTLGGSAAAGTLAAGKAAEVGGCLGTAPLGAGAAGATSGVGLAKLAAWGSAGLLAGATAIGVATVATEKPAQPSAARVLAAASAAESEPSSGEKVRAVPRPSSVVNDEPKPAPATSSSSSASAPRSNSRASIDPVSNRVPQSPPRPTASSLEDELPLIEAAQLALGRGEAQRALRLLAEHERRFPSGTFVPERLAGRALALCRLGRHAEAGAPAAALRRSSPHSPLLPRVAQVCGTDE